MQLSEITIDDALTAETYDQLTCCGQPAHIAHATDSLPVSGAVCNRCLCAVTSGPGYGPVTVSRCHRHNAA